MSKMSSKKTQYDIKDFEDRVICGDCIDIMRKIPANSVDTVITDPP